MQHGLKYMCTNSHNSIFEITGYSYHCFYSLCYLAWVPLDVTNWNWGGGSGGRPLVAPRTTAEESETPAHTRIYDRFEHIYDRFEDINEHFEHFEHIPEHF